MNQEVEVKDEGGDASATAERREAQNAYFVNEEKFTTRDDAAEGRDILMRAGFNPASEHVLIQLLRPGSKSIGLDEPVLLALGGREEFRAFSSDRNFNFTVDEVGYEWGNGKISEQELRDITGAPENKDFVLEREGEPDQVIEPNGFVDLASRGTEHIVTKKRLIEIVVNLDDKKVAKGHLTYDELVALAFNPVPSGPQITFTITYRKGPAENPKGTLPEGGTVKIKNGMIFVVTPTNRS